MNRYEVIAWDGFGRWATEDYRTRERARKFKQIACQSLYLINLFPGGLRGVFTVRIWDRERKEFIR